MEFGFTEEQLMFRDSVYKFAKKEIVPLVEEADLKRVCAATLSFYFKHISATSKVVYIKVLRIKQ